MFLIRVSSDYKLGKGHISGMKIIRNSFQGFIWFVDKDTKSYYLKR